MNIFPMNGSVLPPVDELVVVDTNVLVRLLGYHDHSPNVDAQELKDFITTLATNGNILVYTIKSCEEISNVMKNEVLLRLKPNFASGVKHKTIIKNTPGFCNLVETEVNSVWNGINGLPHFYNSPIGIIDNELLKNARANTVAHDLLISDSIIYTIAKNENIQHIISCDGDFTTINDSSMNLYLDSNNYTKHVQST